MTESLGHGGAEQNLLTLLKRMPPHRYRHHLAWMYRDDVLVDQFRPYVATLIPLGASPGLGHLPAILRLAYWIHQNRPAVLHTQLVRAQLVTRIASVFAGRKPVVTTWQSALYSDRALSDFGNSRIRRDILRRLDRWTSKIDRHFIAVSEYLADDLGRDLKIDRSRISVNFNAIEPDRYRPIDPANLAAKRTELNLATDARVLLSVGRLVESKGHHDAISAMPAILRDFPTAVLIIAGSGPKRADLDLRVKSLGLTDHVRLLGPRNDVRALYQLADAFVFPTRYEGLSVALLEAVSNGLPAVVTDIPPNREIANALTSVRFVAIGDVPALTEAVVQTLRAGSASRASAAAARAGLIEKFSPERIAARFGEALERAAGRTTQV